MRKISFILFLVLSIAIDGAFVDTRSQIRVSRSRWVDTTDTDVYAVFELWTEYLNARPDTMWGGSAWTPEQARFWSDIDLTASLIYEPNDRDFFSTYKPTVMAIVSEGRRYSIRTLFYAEGLRPPDDYENPGAIVRVYAERENGDYGAWKLRNALGVNTEQWNRPAIGKLTFVSEPSREFDIELARRSVAFCDSITGAFPFFDWDPFEFYIAQSREEAARILGVEYSIDGNPEGYAMRRYDILVSGKGSEWYPRGFARMVSTGPALSPHRVVREGFVTWLCDRYDRTFAAKMSEVAAAIGSDDAISFQDYVDRTRDAPAISRHFYGAILCEMVYDAQGSAGIEALFRAGTTDEDLYEAIESILGYGRREFQTAWRQKIMEFL
jgi:hypothetical protein